MGTRLPKLTLWGLGEAERREQEWRLSERVEADWEALGGQEEVGGLRRKCSLGEQNDQKCPSPRGLGPPDLDGRAGGGMNFWQTQLWTR